MGYNEDSGDGSAQDRDKDGLNGLSSSDEGHSSDSNANARQKAAKSAGSAESAGGSTTTELERETSVKNMSSSSQSSESPVNISAETPPKKVKKKKRNLQAPQFEIPRESTGKKVSIDDIRDMIVWVLTSTSPKCMTPSPRWVIVNNHYQINRFVVINVTGLSRDMFGIDSTKKFLPTSLDGFDIKELSFFKNTFKHVWPIQSPGSRDSLFSVVGRFSSVPLTQVEKKRIDRDDKAKRERSKKTSHLELTDLLLTRDQMKEQDYPLHPLDPSTRKARAYSRLKIGMQLKPEFRDALIQEEEEDDGDSHEPHTEQITTLLGSEPRIVLLSPDLPAGWIDSQPCFGVNREVYSIDCEMCESSIGPVLTRATILRRNEVIYDELVKPAEFITDYLTRYSGITEEMLKPVENTIGDVHDFILKTIHAEDIIIGHSLNSDLNALRLRHPNVIDTSIIFQDARGASFKPSLKWLAKGLLNRTIQSGVHGHDSVEDALATYDLAMGRIRNGEMFGAIKAHNVNLVKKLLEEEPSLTTAIVDYGVPTWDNNLAKSIISCSDDDEVTKNAIKVIPKHSLTWLRLQELGMLRGWSSFSPAAQQSPSYTPSELALHEAYVRLNARLQAIYDSLPCDTAVVILSGSGDPREMLNLKEKRKQFNKEYRTKKWDEISGFTQDDEFNLNVATEDARSGLGFLVVKTEEDASKSSKRHKSPVVT